MHAAVHHQGARVGFFSALNPDCTASGDVNIRITKEP
jgi:hypothetical protein